MNMIKMKHAFAAAAVMALCASASAANLVTNGSFETGDFSGWNFGGNTGATGVSDVSGFGVTPTDGNFEGYFGAVGSDTVLSQQLTVNAGATYTVSFDLDDLSGNGPQDFSASFGGATLVSYTSQPFATYTHESFTAVGGNGDLVFTARQDPSYWLMDNVSVVQTASPVPEAASSSMMLAGVALLGFAALRRRQAR
jgi:hypothetical protein